VVRRRSGPAKFQVLPGETLEGLLSAHAEVARHTDELVRTLPDLDVSQPLPGFCRGSSRVSDGPPAGCCLDIVAETAWHAAHADILRETIDGQKTVG
jgi:hypothetical protein